MTDPTGRQQPSGVAAQAHDDEHPLPETPRPFTREAMDAYEREIKDAILRMGSMVSERILGAIDALENHDPDAATAIIKTDHQVNAIQEQVNTLVVQAIAREQPVARDLRYLMALDRVAYDLERMGDHASSVAKQARKLAPHAPLKNNVHLPELGRMVAKQVRDILTAVVDVDQDRARAVARTDDQVDDLYHLIFDETLELMRADPANVDPGARILFAAHYLERTGDRVTNIAEDIVFLATGEVEDLNP